MGGVGEDVSIIVMDILNIQISMSKCRRLTRPTPRFQGSFAFWPGWDASPSQGSPQHCLFA